MDNKEREEMDRRECEREERQEATAACMAQHQRRGRERDGIEKGQVDAKKSEKEERGAKNGKI